MNKPDHVTIGPHRWSIQYNKEELGKISTAKYDTPGNLLGYTSNLELTIYIDPDLPPSLMHETLIHEIWHALFFVYNLNVSKPENKNDEDREPEEDFIQDVTAPMLQLIKQNDHVFGWLYATEEGQ